jgi:pimeloyl-ACP methyl ester carboxylesterase
MTSSTDQVGIFVPVEGGQLYAETQGQGDPIVFVHAGICNADMWEPQVEAFAASHQVVRYDTRGFGRSKTESVAFSNRADLAAVLDHFGIEQAILVGCSRGGQIVLDFTLERPERVRGLVWICGGLSGFEYAPPADASAAELAEMKVFQQLEATYERGDFALLAEQEIAAWVDGPGQPTDRIPADMRQKLLAMNLANCVRDDGTPESKPFNPPAAGRLGELRVPVLVVLGDLDFQETHRSAEYLAANAPQAHLEVFHGCAHVPSLERPAEFNRLLAEYVGGLA